MDIFFEEILKRKNKPIIEEEYNSQNHLILTKYTSKAYYKYSIELLQSLISKSEYTNKIHIFFMSLYYLLKILYNFKNIPYIDNYDLLILSSFSLGIKASVDQHKTPFITKLKNVYPQKYSFYPNHKIHECEVICMKLLDYNINILTSYDCLYFLFSKDVNKFSLLIKEIENIIFNNVNEILFKKPYELVLEIINNFNIKNQNIRQTLLITKKTVPFLNKKDKKIAYNESTPTTSFSSSYGSCNNTRNNFNSKRLKGLRSQSNMEINNKNIINNVNQELNNIYKNNNFIIIRCNNSANKEENKNDEYIHNDNDNDKDYDKDNNNEKINNNEFKKSIYKNIEFNIYDNRIIKNNQNIKYNNNNIKILKHSAQNKKTSNDFYMNTSSNKNISSKNKTGNANPQKIQINQFLCFSSKKSPIKTNSKFNEIDNNNNNNLNTKNNFNKNKLINNMSSNNLINTRIQNRSGNNIFKKPTIEKQKIKTTFKNKKIVNNKNYKKEISFNSALKNCNIHYRKISDLCKKINFDVFNSISEKDKKDKKDKTHN